jgi:choline dehydrogenase-like flavoprotein
MVQGAAQTAGRWPDEQRMYKAPPPEVSSEQFYETDTSRGFARGFSIQTVSPLPIGWSEHVLADGHWGRALREYMRDYNHWATVGVLNELLPLPDNRVTLATGNQATDPYGIPVARFDYTRCANDEANMAYSTKMITDILHAADAQDVLTIHRYAHLVGGGRMGFSPRDSVVDSDQRMWGVPNLFLADGSVCPTQGSANPALTIMALASRLGERIATGKVTAEAVGAAAG